MSSERNNTTNLASLVVTKDHAFKTIEKQVEVGGKIIGQYTQQIQKLDQKKLDNQGMAEHAVIFLDADAAYDKWNAYNVEMLQRFFDKKDLVETYKNFESSGKTINWSSVSVVLRASMLRLFALSPQHSFLQQLLVKLELIPELQNNTTYQKESKLPIMGKGVFIVHGQDNEAKEMVGRFVDNLGLQAKILHELPNKGHTLIEKFEEYSHVEYAIILLTPDDLGASKQNPKTPKYRARQNVIFELGYFIGKIGRDKVCALYKEGVEIPSDISGVVYITMDEFGAWRLSLAQEMQSAGVEFDITKIFKNS